MATRLGWGLIYWRTIFRHVCGLTTWWWRRCLAMGFGDAKLHHWWCCCDFSQVETSYSPTGAVSMMRTTNKRKPPSSIRSVPTAASCYCFSLQATFLSFSTWMINSLWKSVATAHVRYSLPCLVAFHSSSNWTSRHQCNGSYSVLQPVGTLLSDDDGYWGSPVVCCNRKSNIAFEYFKSNLRSSFIIQRTDYRAPAAGWLSLAGVNQVSWTSWLVCCIECALEGTSWKRMI